MYTVIISTRTHDKHELVTESVTFGRVAVMVDMKTDEVHVSAMYECMGSYNACTCS